LRLSSYITKRSSRAASSEHVPPPQKEGKTAGGARGLSPAEAAGLSPVEETWLSGSLMRDSTEYRELVAENAGMPSTACAVACRFRVS
jgi:hypothetical protein